MRCVLTRVSNDAKSGQLARAGCDCGSTTAARSPCSTCSLACAVLLHSFASFVLDSTRAKLVLWIRPTLRAHVAFLTTVPTNSVLAWLRIMTLILTCASCLAVLAITFPFLAFPAFLPHLPKLATSIGSEVLFATTVLNAN